MPEPCTVIIGSPDFLPGLRERASALNGDGELIAFSDAEPLRALDTISRRRPQLIAFERLFAVTPRGVAMINRIKADPALRDSEIRVLEHNSDYSRVVPRAPAAAAPPLDQRGTRRAPRVKMADRVTVIVDAKVATLVDLSTVGAHVILSAGLKPNQRTEVAFNDGVCRMKCAATVVWTSFEMSDAGPRFRAGLDFVDADQAALDGFAQRHKA
ncbi:MAG TPA: PilZ domain-containing protein [Vicinamibacterales bacterium]|nr:PilZ domain-containing protein [Vicinamibacterales bacterium]